MSLVHFRSIVAGALVEIHTEHLNNTVLNQALSNPDKVLRMLLKIDALVHPRWSFAPGRGQFGDGPSRNTPDRAQVREESENKIGAPKTLAEVFAAVAKSTLEGSDVVDDCEKHTVDRLLVGNVESTDLEQSRAEDSESTDLEQSRAEDSNGSCCSRTTLKDSQVSGSEQSRQDTREVPEVMRRVLARELHKTLS